jgi:hypothetical protein
VFVALGIQHAMRMRRITVSIFASPALQRFSTYLTNGTIFKKKSYSAQNAYFDFSINLVGKVYLSKKKLGRYDQKFISVFMYPLFLSDFNET